MQSFPVSCLGNDSIPRGSQVVQSGRVAVRVWIAGVLSLMLWAGVCQAEIYRWVDDNGKVHFGDRPPATQKTEKLEINTHTDWKPFDIKVYYQNQLLSEGSSTIDVSRIQRSVNLVYRFFDEILYFDFYKQVPVTIKVFPDMATYSAHVMKVTGRPAGYTKGIYIGQTHEIALYFHTEKMGGIESTHQTIKHEVSHAILHSLARLVPHWLHEGLAEQMETLVFQDGQFVIRPHEQNRAFLVRNRDRTMKVLDFVEIRSDHWRAHSATATNYAMAGQLIYRLFSTSYGRSCVTRLLQDYKRGERLRSYYLLDKHYIGGAETFRVHWEQWSKTDMSQPRSVVLR